mgnify:CR=1 FL=1
MKGKLFLVRGWHEKSRDRNTSPFNQEELAIRWNIRCRRLEVRSFNIEKKNGLLLFTNMTKERENFWFNPSRLGRVFFFGSLIFERYNYKNTPEVCDTSHGIPKYWKIPPTSLIFNFFQLCQPIPTNMI